MTHKRIQNPATHLRWSLEKVANVFDFEDWLENSEETFQSFNYVHGHHLLDHGNIFKI